MYSDENLSRERAVRIGVVTQRGKEICRKEWSPTADYLSEVIPERKFVVIPLPYSIAMSTIERNLPDFVFLPPPMYVEAEKSHGVSRIATLVNIRNQQPSAHFGGVLFYRKQDHPVILFKDMKGMSLAAVHPYSLGGWLAVNYEMHREKVNPERLFRSVEFAGEDRLVFEAVKSGKTDAGIVRTGVLEKLIKEAGASEGDFKVVRTYNRNKSSKELYLSTSDYPEWPFARLEHIPDSLARKVASALLALPPDAPACRAAGYYGWTIPQNYQSVNTVMKELEMGPYSTPEKVSLFQAAGSYWYVIVGALVVISVLVVFAVIIYKSRKKLSESQKIIAQKLIERNQEDMIQRRHARDLLERIKELDCIFKISNLAENPDLQVGDILKNVVEIVPTGFRYPEQTKIRLTLHDSIFCSPEFSESPYMIMAGLTLQGSSAGRVEAFRTVMKHEKIEDPFQEEEKKLLVHVASQTSNMINRISAETALRDREIKYRELVQNANSIILRMDNKGNVTFLNEFAENFFGFPKDEIIGRNVVGTIVSPESDIGENILDYFAEVASGRGHAISENENICKDGRKVWVTWSNRPIFDADSTFTEMLCVGNDITQIKQAEENLHLFHQLMDHSQDALFVVKPLDGEVIYVNRRGELILQMEREQIVGRNIGALTEIARNDKEWNAFVEKMRLEGPQVVEKERMKDDGLLPIEISVKHVSLDSEDYIIAIARDITERKQTEKRFTELNKCLVSFGSDCVENLHNLTELSLDLLNGDLVVYFRHGLSSIIAGSTEETLNEESVKRIADYVREHSSSEKGVFVEACGGETISAELEEIGAYAISAKSVMYSDKTIGEMMVFYRENCPPGLSSEKILGIITSAAGMEEERLSAHEELVQSTENVNDMNVRLQANQQQLVQSEKMASLGQLAAGVAHEINNPIGYITSNLGTLCEYLDTLNILVAEYSTLTMAMQKGRRDKAMSALKKVHSLRKQDDIDFILEDVKVLLNESIEGTRRVRDIVVNLKSFARLDEAVQKSADLNECLESTVKIVWNELKYKCSLNKDLNPIPQINCYPGQLNQVFMNLLVNASHAIDKKGEITIHTHAEGNCVVIRISDNGSGIPEENRARLFDPFFTTKPVGKGTGLGLSISHGIIQKHNGTISVESEVGKGSAFTIQLPVDETEGQE